MYEHVARDLREQSCYLPREYTYRLVCEAADAIDQLEALCKRQEAKLVELTEELASKPRWVPVAERLPESQGPFLTRYGFGDASIETGQFFYGVLYYLYADAEPHWQHESVGVEVTHWMPLPEPPKEEA